MRNENDAHSLQPTGLVHEAFLRLFDGQSIEWNDRVHFFALAAKVMRQILVDHARRRYAKGGQRSACLLEGFSAAEARDSIDLIVEAAGCTGILGPADETTTTAKMTTVIACCRT